MALVLLVAQVGVVGCVLQERILSTQVAAHAERPVPVHHATHNESTCALCALSSMDAIASHRPHAEAPPPLEPRAESPAFARPPASPELHANASRAPPVLTG